MDLKKTSEGSLKDYVGMILRSTLSEDGVEVYLFEVWYPERCMLPSQVCYVAFIS